MVAPASAADAAPLAAGSVAPAGAAAPAAGAAAAAGTLPTTLPVGNGVPEDPVPEAAGTGVVGTVPFLMSSAAAFARSRQPSGSGT
ncbi:hypothetical protein SRABI128_01891 [Microbacterium sp. Bi128]|nr:hypothetical protein SRABI128_01891 [Microbacterium sp. Bi128]